MSDDEKSNASSDEDDVRCNVVASAVREGCGGGAFATGPIFENAFAFGGPEILGIDGFDLSGAVASRRRTNEDAYPSRRRASSDCVVGRWGTSQSSSGMSPLIAQLNPFTPLTPPLSASAVGYDGTSPPGGELVAVSHGVHEDHVEDAGDISNGTGVDCRDAHAEGPSRGDALEDAMYSDAAGDVDSKTDRLLLEMGELVCQFQKREPLSLESEEVSTESLLERLALFKEVADRI